MKEKMDFSEFRDWAQHSILSYLPEEYREAEVTLYPVVKAGVSYTGMIVRKNEEITAAAVNLEEAFSHYLLDMPLFSIGERMAEIVMSRQPEFDKELFSDYEKIKDRLFVRLCNAEENREMLENVPHRKVCDLALTCHVLLSSGEEGMTSAMITDPLLKELGVSKEVLYNDALFNSEKILPARIEPIRSMLESLCVGREFDGLENMPVMTVVTNSLGINGAAALFYPGVADEVARQMNGRFYILPSSVHELIAVPVSDSHSCLEMEKMVREINCLTVAPEDRLSDRVYRYDGRERSFRFGREEEKTKERKEREER